MPRLAAGLLGCAGALACLLAGPSRAPAQTVAAGPDATKNPLVTSLANLHFYYAGIVSQSAEEMPESNYDFRPTPEVRTFGGILAHIADSEYEFCSPVKGGANPHTTSLEKTKMTKAALATALHEAFAYCDATYAALSDARLSDSVSFFGGMRTQLFVLAAGVTHTGEHYGNLVTYLRMKGLVPPTSAPAPKTAAAH
jgi:uncharacterized damage-inducible protein DinB